MVYPMEEITRIVSRKCAPMNADHEFVTAFYLSWFQLSFHNANIDQIIT